MCVNVLKSVQNNTHKIGFTGDYTRVLHECVGGTHF